MRVKINQSYKNHIENLIEVSSVGPHYEVDWEEGILSDNNFLATTKTFQEHFFDGSHFFRSNFINGGGCLTRGGGVFPTVTLNVFVFC